MGKNNKNRMSFITVSILVIIIVVVAIVCLKLFVLDKSSNSGNNNSTAINKGDSISSIEGEENVAYEDGVKKNVSEYVQEEQYLDEFAFSNFNVYCIDGITKIEFDVYNESENRQNLDSFKFKIYANENVAGTITCYGEEFAAGQTKRLNVTIDCDVANMSDIIVEPIYSNVM